MTAAYDYNLIANFNVNIPYSQARLNKSDMDDIERANSMPKM